MADKKIFTLQAHLVGVTPLKDNGVSLRFQTQEMSPAEKVVLMDSFQKFGHLLWSEDEITEQYIPDKNTDIEGRKIKTPSQRQRAVIYLDWKYNTDQSMTADAYYEQEIEKFINWKKSKLPD